MRTRMNQIQQRSPSSAPALPAKDQSGGMFYFWAGLFVVVLISRLCHCGILWADEDYHIAAAIQALHGKVPYRDFWYDKPVLNIVSYLMFEARTDWVLRLAGSLNVCVACAFAYRFASRLWTRLEGYLAASLLAFFLIFYFHGANIPLQPDTLMLAPHVAAVYFAWQRRFFLAGAISGLAFLLNAKGLFVLASCALFGLGGSGWLILGFAAPNALALGWLYSSGALLDYWQQVWGWGFHYLKTTESPIEGIHRVFSWLGFHFALAVTAVFAWLRERDLFVRFALWTAISLAAVGVGWRFSPHYFNQLLPPLVIAGARGISLMIKTPAARLHRIALRILMILSLVIPIVRFGPRYILLANDLIAGKPHHWKDLARNQTGWEIAQIVGSIAKNKDTVFIWGYWPNIIAYTRLPIASRFWDAQPLTGIPANQFENYAGSLTADDQAAKNRLEFIRTKPDIIVDELGILNPRVDIRCYPELRAWFQDYSLVSATEHAHIYRLNSRNH